MTRVLLVRHGRAAAAWADAADPGLDALGRSQAEATAAHLATVEAPMLVRSSPRARARETAEPLARRWGCDVEVDDRFDEVPSPAALVDDPAGRSAWLQAALGGRWAELDDDIAAWRRGLVEAVRSLERDAVVCTHFVAINALVSFVRGDEDVTVFLPDHASVTELTVAAATGELAVVRLGMEAGTEVR